MAVEADESDVREPNTSWWNDLTHHDWKRRKAAYETLAATMGEADGGGGDVMRKYGVVIGKALRDKHAAVQAAAIEAAMRFASAASADICVEAARSVGQALAEHVFNSRTWNRNRGVELFMCFVEAGAAAGLFEGVCDAGMVHKVAKVVVTCVQTFRQALRKFGASVLPIGVLLSNLCALIEHKSGEVRAEAKQLAVELYSGNPTRVRAALTNAPRTAKRDLDRAFKEVEKQRETQLSATQGERKAEESSHDESSHDVLPLDETEQEEPSLDATLLRGKPGLGLAKVSVPDLANERETVEGTELQNSPNEALHRCRADGRICAEHPAPALFRVGCGEENVEDIVAGISDIAELARVEGSDMEGSTAQEYLSIVHEKLSVENVEIDMAAVSALTLLLDGGCVDLQAAFPSLDIALTSKVPSVRVHILKWLTRQAKQLYGVEEFRSHVEDLVQQAVFRAHDSHQQVQTAALRFLAAWASVQGGVKELHVYTSNFSPIRPRQVTKASPASMKPDVSAGATSLEPPRQLPETATKVICGSNERDGIILAENLHCDEKAGNGNTPKFEDVSKAIEKSSELRSDENRGPRSQSNDIPQEISSSGGNSTAPTISGLRHRGKAFHGLPEATPDTDRDRRSNGSNFLREISNCEMNLQQRTAPSQGSLRTSAHVDIDVVHGYPLKPESCAATGSGPSRKDLNDARKAHCGSDSKSPRRVSRPSSLLRESRPDPYKGLSPASSSAADVGEKSPAVSHVSREPEARALSPSETCNQRPPGSIGCGNDQRLDHHGNDGSLLPPLKDCPATVEQARHASTSGIGDLCLPGSADRRGREALGTAIAALATQTPQCSNAGAAALAEETPGYFYRVEMRTKKVYLTGQELATEQLREVQLLLASPDYENRVSGCKKLHWFLNSAPEILEGVQVRRTLTQIVFLLIDGSKRALETLDTIDAESKQSRRELKYALNGLLQIFGYDEAAHCVNPDAVSLLFSNLLTLLTDTSPRRAAGKESSSKGFNVLLLRLLENADRLDLYNIILECLGKAAGNFEDGRSLSPNEKKRLDLAVKCLMKVAGRGFDDLDLSALLRDIHVFLSIHTKARLSPALPTEASLPIRCVKSLLSKIVDAQQHGIFDYLDGVPTERDPVIYHYIKSALKVRGG